MRPRSSDREGAFVSGFQTVIPAKEHVKKSAWRESLSFSWPGLIGPSIKTRVKSGSTWMAGSSPAMTMKAAADFFTRSKAGIQYSPRLAFNNFAAAPCLLGPHLRGDNAVLKHVTRRSAALSPSDLGL